MHMDVQSEIHNTKKHKESQLLKIERNQMLNAIMPSEKELDNIFEISSTNKETPD